MVTPQQKPKRTEWWQQAEYYSNEVASITGSKDNTDSTTKEGGKAIFRWKPQYKEQGASERITKILNAKRLSPKNIKALRMA